MSQNKNFFIKIIYFQLKNFVHCLISTLAMLIGEG